jgi:CubicO group peptidase (beta-lactamase class C family)
MVSHFLFFLYQQPIMKRYTLICSLGWVFPALFLTPVQAQQKAILADSVVSSLAKAGFFNGNVLLAEKGHVLYSKSFGYAAEYSKRTLDEQSVFELASCSKQFTAAAIVLLQQQGSLSYDDLLGKWIPALQAYKGVTVRHLLHHTSGIPDYMELMDTLWDHKKIATNKDVINMLARYHPQPEFEPGTKFEYSNTGYALLASIIEAASGKSYDALLKDRIFTPAGMKNSFVYTRRYAPRKVDNYAYGYVFSDSLQRKIVPDSLPAYDRVIWLDGIKGDGTVNSTVGDLLKWDRSLYGNALFSDVSKQLIFTSGKLEDGSETGYGFGWMLKTDSLMGRIAAHSGGWPGYVTYVERHLDKDKTIIILQNTDKGKLPVKAFRSILYEQALIAAPVRIAVQVSPVILEAYVGEYELAPSFIITISMDDGQLFCQATGQSRFALYPESETGFFLKAIDAQIDFRKDESGEVNRLTLHQGGRDTPAPKIR